MVNLNNIKDLELIFKDLNIVLIIQLIIEIFLKKILKIYWFGYVK